ncbi:hypothetical protein A8924_5885 [Saccharopolyspora erythraea NRRL 2338]|uniref:Membrane protein n=2 Tax=Saccharopolyspora erythraea TaxID=1836 RepID=A4FL07_SACEN|nr:DUF6480 family protein [Saccharopolyspora erythraea]PFG98372.1 hypothetical protein A8924_5885 [Saccharopolyspora erythraea NRRL 2338]QRK88442.1 hypothetical protein JQX30_27810 [Saccharopolyspora erythraea]CAM04732.1 putative membrane protein [Saccharopolyspora erythraea NRRL 2338]
MATRESGGPPDPEPERTPGLEPGGSVPPGETPPESGSATEGVSHRQEAEARPVKWVWLLVTAIIVILVAGFFGFLALGLVF